MARRFFASPRLIAFAVLVLLLLTVGRPVLHLVSTAWHDADERQVAPPGTVDDASRLNRTRVAEIVDVDRERAEEQLAELLDRARRDGLGVSIAGARHSMGGHSIHPDGITINMLPFDAMELDAARGLLRVGSGALWSDVIPFLDAAGWSVAVMQSNKSFTVGGSLSVNCHGWQYGRPPIASTVESFRLMKADGAVVRCSRTENPELFSLALGGYGLFGIILEVDLRVVPNRPYRLTTDVVPATEALATYHERVGGAAGTAMVYARMNVDPDHFLDDVILSVLVEEDGPVEGLPPLSEQGLVGLRRTIFRGSAESDYGKKLRWTAETQLSSPGGETVFSRNQLLNEPVEVYANRSADSTDILHEYFVPEASIAGFIDGLRRIIPEEGGNLLNVTVRHIEEDTDTFLRYADRPMLSLVMLFHQERTDAGEAAMEKLTRRLIDAALAAGGRHYLPYRLHATPEQFHRAYPMAREFFRRKREHDPDGLFRNQFHTKYGGADVGSQED